MPTVPGHIVAIGASAGGVEALSALVGRLPRNLNAAFFIVLHVPAHTSSALAAILQRVTHVQVAEARDDEPIVRGRYYVAPADRHLMVEPQRVRVTRGPKECRARPSIDVLLRSAAASFGPRAIGVVLTGMLDDGTAGLWAIKDRGGKALVQDPASAQYRSMPDSAMRHVAVDAALPLDALAAEITRSCQSPDPMPADRNVPEAIQIENHIAMEGTALQAGVMKLGKVSKYTCPDSHGVLVRIEQGKIVRFRCHTGHAYSMKTLLTEANRAIDAGLWETLRAIEERILLLREMGELASHAGDSEAAAKWKAQADDAQERVQPLRQLVLDPKLFGHGPERV